MFAPDPYGFFNSYYTATVDEYTSMTLSAEIARSYTNLVLYNYRVLQAESSMEDTWLVETLGTVVADSVGFGAAYHDDAWLYLDAPYLYSLTNYDDDGIIATDPRGAQYLFGRWLVDAFGTDILSAIVQLDSADLGESSADNVAFAASSIGGQELTFGLIHTYHLIGAKGGKWYSMQYAGYGLSTIPKLKPQIRPMQHICWLSLKAT